MEFRDLENQVDPAPPVKLQVFAWQLQIRTQELKMFPGQWPGEPLEEGLARAEATEAVSIFPATSTSPCSPGLEAGAFPTPNHQPDDGQRPNATHGGEGGGMQIQQGCGGAGGGDSPAPEAGHSAPDLLRRRHLLSWRLAFLIPGLQSSKGDSNSKANTTPWAGSGCRYGTSGVQSPAF